MKPISKADVLRTYRNYAGLYDLLFGSILQPGRTAMGEVVRALRPEKLLEVGVGTGLMVPLYPPETLMTGIDLSEAMLEVAKKRQRDDSLREVELRVMDAENMDFPDHTFDCVTLPYVLSVTPNPSRLVEELRRVCKPGGTIVILNHFSGSGVWWLLEQITRPFAARLGFRSDFGLDEHVFSHNWCVESVRSVNLFGLSRLVVIRNVVQA